MPEVSLRSRRASHPQADPLRRAIAGTLFLSEKTVESHLARIFRKLDVRSRVELAGLIARDAPKAVR